MTDLFKSKEHEFYIELKQERYYFPGEDILGDVILDITKATKTNNIKVVLEGTVEIGGRTITLFSKYVLIAQSLDGEKSYYLEPLTHRFPFVITIPALKECKVPSTLEIAKLLKVSYRLTAIFNKPFTVLEKFSASTTTPINILENINVESTEYGGDYKVEKKLTLTGETRPVTVSTIIGKRAAVKGDTIPVLVTIEHIGVMVRDKAISVQLLRSVYYGRNKSEIFGPKILREATSNIEILGPVKFTKTFDLRLAIPSNLCPTVEKSGQTFKIEYTLRILVNLNEENPHRPEVAQNIVLFNVPFTIGTYPKLSFNIDDDEEDEDEEIEQKDMRKDEVASNHSSEYDEVAEKMKNMDLSLEAVPPQMIQQSPRLQAPPTPPAKNVYTPLPALSTSPKPTYIPPPMLAKQEPPTKIEKKDSISKPDAPSSSSTENLVQVPMIISKPSPVPPMLSSSSPAVKPLERLPSSGSIAVLPMISSPPIVKSLDRLSSNGSTISPFPTSKMKFATDASLPTKFSSPKQQPPIGSPESPPVSQFKSNSPTATTTPTPPLERVTQQNTSLPKVNIRPSEIYNDYQPVLSPTPSIHQHDSVASMQQSTSNSTSNVGLGRQDSVRWIVRNQDASTPAAVTSPVISNNNNSSNGYPPILPPRPTPSPVNSNKAQPGFNLPQANINGSPLPPFPTNNYHHQQNNYNHHYSPPQAHHHPSSYPPPLQHYDSFSSGGMPVAQPAPPPQYNNYSYNNQYGNASPPPPPQPPSQQYNNNYNRHPLQHDNNLSFPVPQHPHTHGDNMGMMGMPSHQNYLPYQQPYPSFYNNN